MDILNGPGGQLLLAVLSLATAYLLRYLGRRFDVTEEQAREFLNVLTELRQSGKDVLESDLAREVQRRVRAKAKGY